MTNATPFPKFDIVLSYDAPSDEGAVSATWGPQKAYLPFGERKSREPFELCRFAAKGDLVGAFRRGKKPLVLPGEEK